VSQGQYVALAYGVVLVFVLLWVAIIATKLSRLERETGELADIARSRDSGG
jgi:ABC-type transporter Mla subunit MlaD